MSISNEDPLVSIVIPAFNRQDIIEETIQCAINQTYKNIEIIITDNDSDDDTWNVINRAAENDNRIKAFRNEKNLGPVLNWQSAINKVNGEYIKILWSDDRMSDNFVESSLKMFDSDTAFIISPVTIFNSDNGSTIDNVDYKKILEFSIEDFFDNILFDNYLNFMVSPGCAIFRTGDVRQALYIDVPNKDGLDFKKYGAGNDLLIFLLSAIKYAKLKVNPYATSSFRHHEKSISIERQSEINLYYEWSKQFFINNFYPSLNDIYKSRLFLKFAFNKKFKNIYQNSDGTVRIKHLINSGFRKFFRKNSNNGN